MISTAYNCIFLSESSSERHDKDGSPVLNADGSPRLRYQASFVQDGDTNTSVFELSPDLFGTFEKLGTYSLDIELNQFNFRTYPKVVGYAEC